jgi:GSCFA family
MNFSTKIPIEKFQFPIDYNSKILSLGSCFAENMSEKFDYFKFQNIVNPFGIIFNAVSIERIIERIVNQEEFSEKDIFYHNEMWHCFDVHSRLSNADKVVFLSDLNQILEQSRNQIFELSHCIITYGTSWVYRNIETNKVVANCHKIPQKHFSKELLTSAITHKSIENTIALIQNINPNCKFIFTVSPVRHIKDGFVENNVSKSMLLTAIYNQLQTESRKPNIKYFPSYEILLDELRDYRFYANDMLHPSQLAIDYIWNRFSENYINENEFATMKEVFDIQKAIMHKPFNLDSEIYSKFSENLKSKITNLIEKQPNIIF